MAPPTYLDFDLLIERTESACKARVLGSPAGEASADFELPFNPDQLEIFVLRAITMGSRRRVRRLQSPDMKQIKGFGIGLFDAVFDGDVRDCLRRSLDEADRLDRGLRIRLRIDDAAGANGVSLLSVPWEFLYDSSGAGFLCLSQQSPLVRYAELPQRPKPLLVTGPLNVLAMVSSPRDFPELDVEHEWVQLQGALAEPIDRGILSLTRMEHATLKTLQQDLRRNEFHVFHFIGHGAFSESAQEGVLLFEQKDGRGDPVGSESLRSLFQNSRDLCMVVLNSCEGARSSPTDPFAGTAQRLVQGGVLAVIAMQLEITDEAAITFSSEFYAALADGYPVDAALAEARTAVFTRVNEVEWAIPVLYLRAPDGRIFDVDRPIGDEVTARIPKLHREASALIEEGKAARAEKVLGEILSLAPEDEGAAALLESAREQSRVEDLVASASAQYATGDLGTALEALRRLLSKGGDHRDAKELALAIEDELEGSGPGTEERPASEGRAWPRISLGQASLLADPGGEITTDVAVRNEGDSEVKFRLDVLGDAAQWASVDPPVLSIPPGATERAEVGFRPPAPGLGSRPGPHGFSVRVRSESDPTTEESAWGVLGISAIRKVNARLDPGTGSPGVYPHTLSVQNLGNVPVTAELNATSRERSLSVVAEPAFMRVGEGETATADVVARTSRPLVGKRRTAPFRVEVGGPDVERVEIEGEVPLQPRTPVWAALVGMFVIAALIAGWFLTRPDVPSVRVPADVVGMTFDGAKRTLQRSGFTASITKFSYMDCKGKPGRVRQVLGESTVLPNEEKVRTFDGHPIALYRENTFLVLAGIDGEDHKLLDPSPAIPASTPLHVWISNGLNDLGAPCGSA